MNAHSDEHSVLYKDKPLLSVSGVQALGRSRAGSAAISRNSCSTNHSLQCLGPELPLAQPSASSKGPQEIPGEELRESQQKTPPAFRDT